MSGEKLSLEQFSALLKNIDSGLGPAASQLWKEGVNTEVLLGKLTKQDMHMAGINLGSRVLIYSHFHPTDAGALSTPAAALTQTARFRELDAAMGRVGLPSNYAKDIVKQAELANGTVFNCYRSSRRPVPLALLYPEFDEFCLRCASPAGISVRDSLFCLELCQEMQHFVSKDIKRERTFGTLFREYLQGQLSSDMAFKHQTRGKSIIDIQLQVKVADYFITMVYIEIKREAGSNGDAQQEGMAYLLKDHATEEFMASWPTLRPALLLTVVGPSVRAFGMCVDANSTLVCEPLCPAIDMLLIPHLPQPFAMLASLFSAMPQLVQDLYDHYRHASSTTKKLNFLGSYNEQLPYPLWDPEVWTEARLLGPADIHKLVYVAIDLHKQQQVVKFTKQYGWDVHRTWAKAGIAPMLLTSTPTPNHGRWQQVQMEYLPSDVGWLTMRFLMMPSKEQLKYAPDHFVLRPADMPEMFQKAQQLLQKAHSIPVAGSLAAHGDARPENIMVLVEAGKVKQLKLIDMDWAGSVGSTHYPVLLNTKKIVWPDGVGPGQALQQKHDIELLHLQITSATRAASSDWRAMFAHSVQVSDMDVDL